MSALHEAAACGDIDKLEDLLAQNRINKNEKDEDWDGRTPLFWASIEGHVSCVKLLLEVNISFNFQRFIYLYSILMEVFSFWSKH